MDENTGQTVELIPIDRISVANPRVRNQRIFSEIVDNIAEIGLKKPITVTRRADDADGPRFYLVCGQGRLEAYQALGQTTIPALVIEADAEERMIKSLVENCARRQHKAIDLLHDISRTDGVGVVCSLHQVHLARVYADRVVGLLRGRVVLDMPTDRFDEAAFERLYGSLDPSTVLEDVP